MDLPFAHPHAALQPCIRTNLEAGGGALGHRAVSRFRQRAVGKLSHQTGWKILELTEFILAKLCCCFWLWSR